MASAEPPGRPVPVRWALAMLWAALATMVIASVVYYRSSGVPLAVGDVAGHLLGYALLSLLQWGIGNGNAWARILFVVFLGWKLALAAFNLLLESTQLPWLYGLDLGILLVQSTAAALLFVAPSRAWFMRAR